MPDAGVDDNLGRVTGGHVGPDHLHVAPPVGPLAAELERVTGVEVPQLGGVDAVGRGDFALQQEVVDGAPRRAVSRPAASATQVRRYQPPSGWGSRSSAAMSDSPGRTAPVWSASGGGDAEAGGDRQRMHGGTAEEHAIGRGALDIEMGVVLPGEADTAEGLDRFAADQDLAVVAGGLGHGDGRWRGSACPR